MVELREVDTARAMLRQTPVFNRMKQEEPDRFLKLEHLCGRTYFDIRSVYVHLLDSPKRFWHCDFWFLRGYVDRLQCKSSAVQGGVRWHFQ